ncbi:uncharacterized protein LOC118403910 isoform X3 [Branchiostoma floridae]|uniref:Uncharacterized protein LOC118403910 isoform X3 n=1 Tax=Branchiostoma floridae TaxID=7739 RepID=A0A9J7HG31_BRAFL|nr:uncharacterized protein LOC118403910 isoform X3 [Branchiostoma floridae]
MRSTHLSDSRGSGLTGTAQLACPRYSQCWILQENSKSLIHLDVAVDCIGRTLLWSCLYKWGFFIACLEWLVFVCTHNMGPAWRATSAPWWVEAVMAKGFKTPAGMFAITGLHVLPLWLYGHEAGVQLYSWHLPHTVHYTAVTLLAVGRALCVPVELWFVWNHVQFLISEKPGPAS